MEDGYELGEKALKQINDLLKRDRGREHPPQSKPRSLRNSDGYAGHALPVLNLGSSEVPPFGIMVFTPDEGVSTTIGTGSSTIGVDIGQQDGVFRRRVLVNGANTLRTGQLGTGYYCDVPFPVLYDTADGPPYLGQVWGPKPGSYKLSAGYYGFEIVGAADVERHTVICIQHLVPNVLGKTGSGFSKGSFGTINVWEASGAEDSTMDIASVYCKFSAVSSDKWVRVTWDGGHPSLTALECA